MREGFEITGEPKWSTLKYSIEIPRVSMEHFNQAAISTSFPLIISNISPGVNASIHQVLQLKETDFCKITIQKIKQVSKFTTGQLIFEPDGSHKHSLDKPTQQLLNAQELDLPAAINLFKNRIRGESDDIFKGYKLYLRDTTPTPTVIQSMVHVSQQMNNDWSLASPANVLLTSPDVFITSTALSYIGQSNTWTNWHLDACSSRSVNYFLCSDSPDDLERIPTQKFHKNLYNPDTPCKNFRCSDRTRSVWLMVQRKHFGTLFKLLSKKQLYAEDTFIHLTDVAKEFEKAKVPLFVAHQFQGDAVLVPSGYAHAVINLGPGISCKYAYNILHASETPNALRTVMFDLYDKREIYRVKLHIDYGAQEYLKRLNEPIARYVMGKKESVMPPMREYIERPAKRQKPNHVISEEGRIMLWFKELRNQLWNDYFKTANVHVDASALLLSIKIMAAVERKSYMTQGVPTLVPPEDHCVKTCDTCGRDIYGSTWVCDCDYACCLQCVSVVKEPHIHSDSTKKLTLQTNIAKGHLQGLDTQLTRTIQFGEHELVKEVERKFARFCSKHNMEVDSTSTSPFVLDESVSTSVDKTEDNVSEIVRFKAFGWFIKSPKGVFSTLDKPYSSFNVSKCFRNKTGTLLFLLLNTDRLSHVDQIDLVDSIINVNNGTVFKVQTTSLRNLNLILTTKSSFKPEKISSEEYGAFVDEYCRIINFKPSEKPSLKGTVFAEPEAKEFVLRVMHTLFT